MVGVLMPFADNINNYSVQKNGAFLLRRSVAAIGDGKPLSAQVSPKNSYSKILTIIGPHPAVAKKFR